ncbi:MAG: hypothetical protein HY369_00680 [Candidatus Aenigmarchaeota archaeon]|nr:hypothetical protein [Candidatus Aenigmarchaeota archaeon]
MDAEFISLARDHPATNHPFLGRFGSLTVEGFRQFVREQYRLSSTFSQALATAYGLAEELVDTDSGRVLPAWQLAQPLADLLRVEPWGSPDGHGSAFLAMADSVGLSLDDLTQHRPYGETQAFTDARARICRDSFLRAVSALGVTECANVTIFGRYLDGARQIRDRERVPIDLDYFEVHVRDEPDDAAKFAGMMAPYLSPHDPGVCSSRGERAAWNRDIALYAGQELLDARKTWYDTLDRRLAFKSGPGQ